MSACSRCGTEKCVDKKFVPYEFLQQYSHYTDCSFYTGPLPEDRTGDGARQRADVLRELFLEKNAWRDRGE